MNAEYAGSNALGTAKCKRSVAPQHLLFVSMARITRSSFSSRPFAIQLHWNCAFDFSFSALASFFPRPAGTTNSPGDCQFIRVVWPTFLRARSLESGWQPKPARVAGHFGIL